MIEVLCGRCETRIFQISGIVIYLNVITREGFKAHFSRYITRITGARTHFVSYARWHPIRLLDSIPIQRISPVNGGAVNEG